MFSNKSITDLIPIIDYNKKTDCFKLKNGGYFDIYQINCKDLVRNSENEINSAIEDFELFFRSHNFDFKIVSLNFPYDTVSQQLFFRDKISKTENNNNRKWLNISLLELEYLANKRTSREYYIFIFFNNENKSNCTNSIQHNLINAGLVDEMTYEKKRQILYKLNNKCSIVSHNNRYNSIDDTKKVNKIIKRKGYNLYLMATIQPSGGITFGTSDTLITTGNGYEICINIYEYPHDVNIFWLADIFDYNNTISIIDVSTIPIIQVKKDIDRSIIEQKSRFVSANKASEENDAQQRYEELQYFYNEITTNNETVKVIQSRIFVCDKDKNKCYENTITVINELEAKGFKATIFLNEQKNDWTSMYMSYTSQQKNIYKRDGQPILSSTLAMGYPYNYSDLSDQYGAYYGVTTLKNGGSVLFDLFNVSSKRTMYNAVILGLQGSGKSTLLKKTFRERASRGDFIRYFDVINESEKLVKELGGKIVALDGTSGILNPLEILKTADTEYASFAQHLSKISTFYHCLSPNCDEFIIAELETILRLLYIQKKIIPASYSANDVDIKVTGLAPEKYPTFSELATCISRVKENLLRNQKNLVAVSDKITRLDKILLIVQNLCNNYGHIFNGHTTFPDIMNEQIVVFNIKGLSAMKQEIFDAQIFNAVYLCWNNNLMIGEPQMHQYNKNELLLKDVVHFIIYIDECHKFINSNKLWLIDQLAVIERENRKVFGSLILATQSVRDLVPEGTSNAGIDSLKRLFEMTQYKFLLKQDSVGLKVINSIFSNVLTETEMQRLLRFRKGQCLLSISGDKSIEFQIDISEEEKLLYSGGA